VEVAQKLSPLFVLLLVVHFVWLVEVDWFLQNGGTKELKVLCMWMRTNYLVLVEKQTLLPGEHSEIRVPFF